MRLYLRPCAANTEFAFPMKRRLETAYKAGIIACSVVFHSSGAISHTLSEREMAPPLQSRVPSKGIPTM